MPVAAANFPSEFNRIQTFPVHLTDWSYYILCQTTEMIVSSVGQNDDMSLEHEIHYPYNITVTSWWARWHLKSPPSRSFTWGKHQSSASLTFVRGIHRWAVNSPHKGPVTSKTFQFDDTIMNPIITSTSQWTYSMIFCDMIFRISIYLNFKFTGTHSERCSLLGWNAGMWLAIALHRYKYCTGLFLRLRPAKERRRYKVTPSLIDWAQA